MTSNSTPSSSRDEGPENTRPRRVAITGIGLITASGIGADRLWDAMQSGSSPVGPVTRFDASSFRTRVAAEVDGFDPADFLDRKEVRRLDRFGHFTLSAVRQAMEDARLDPTSVDPSRGAVQMGSALGGIAHAEEQVGAFQAEGLRGVDARLALLVYCGAASCRTAIDLGFTGPNSTNAMSCASGTIAVGDASRLIRDGRADVVVAGGVEAPLAPLTFGAFSIIRAMTARNDDPGRACRPFDADRDGFVMGEGAGVLILEEESHALERGAHIYALVSGYGTSNDAFHMTAPRPDGREASRAMSDALHSARVDPSEIDHVNAHGSSTPLNDSTESLAIETVLGPRAKEIPVAGTKPFYGHSLGASGAIEAAICALCIDRGWVPPTLNFQNAGEGCELDYTPATGRSASLRHVLTNSFGFGGINASLVLSAVTEPRLP